MTMYQLLEQKGELTLKMVNTRLNPTSVMTTLSNKFPQMGITIFVERQYFMIYLSDPKAMFMPINNNATVTVRNQIASELVKRCKCLGVAAPTKEELETLKKILGRPIKEIIV